MGVTRKDKIRNEYIRGTVNVERLGMKIREGRLSWYKHVRRRDRSRKKGGDGNGVTGKEEKREVEEKIYRCNKGGYRKVGAREKDIGDK